MASDDWLIADDLSLSRGGRPLFDGLHFRLGAGDALLIAGRNGAGKSSLLRLLAGLLAPTAGKVSNPFATGWVAAETALKPDRLVRDELRWWAALDAASAETVDSACAAMAVTALLDFRCGQLSSGQRQRVALARLVASGARLWLLDEPTNALDSASEQRLLAAIDAHRAGGGIVVAASHSPLPMPGARRLELG